MLRSKSHLPRAIPSSLVLDRQGAIAATFVGAITAGDLHTVLDMSA